ncbi:Peptidoglycan/xylan/chitin deacetylase, PgdA/CDA1 family [Ruminococcus sp. YE71]|uniref:polysaccharide deacetylase family protein n=1 Tax=unclassified Ruminococcus TaxID=2608920 RepID=UPI00088DA2FD|nr:MULTISPECIES: polysaccharide deacetylase family protein [unclassified Ruminococcus]SDA10322.1 Peptidoglycan/xylan/chitin deacetylase, PgdA/CDA1 family [Ruminococcus sp. YE78]SFW10815.1 Peptidoglycan/xylan/chitin deacetylase, PgdA/CDA1 family [Ruminococcus sp. YE71]
MNIKKRIFPILFAAVMLSGCAGSDNADGESTSAADKPAETVSAAETTPEDSSSEPEVLVPKEHTYDPEKPLIALTFDDGPNTTCTPQVLDLLEKNDAVGTFFLIGQNINDDNAEVVKRAYLMGCEIADHSYTHEYFTKMTPDQMKEEISKTEELITGIIGKGSTFFRPPYIAVNMDMYENIDLCFISGYGCNDWDSAVTVQERIDKTLEQACDGAIILLHDQPQNFATVEALETIIPSLAEQGYEFVTVSELFEAKGIDPADELWGRYRTFSVVEKREE